MKALVRQAHWLAPALLALYPVLMIAGLNTVEVRAIEVALGGLGCLLVAALAYGAGRALAADRQTAGVLACLMVGAFFTYAPAQAALDKAFVGTRVAVLVAGRFVFPGFFLLAAVAVWAARRRLQRTGAGEASGLSLLLASLLTVPTLVQLVAGVATARAPEAPAGDAAAPARGAAREGLPDIYLVIPDEFARPDVLKRRYGADIDAEVKALEERGFVLPAETMSNYPMTETSIVSMAELDYLEGDLRRLFSREAFDKAIMAGDLRRLVTEKGYRFHYLRWDGVHIADGQEQPRRDLGLLSAPFFQTLLRATPAQVFAGMLVYRERYDLIQRSFAMLDDVLEAPGPKFVFAHVMTPHKPYVVDADGNFRSPSGYRLEDWQNKGIHDTQRARDAVKYGDQATFTVRRMIAFVDKALARPGPRPVIVLQSDHGAGYGFVDYEAHGRGMVDVMKGEPPSEAVLRYAFERHAEFAAVLVDEPHRAGITPEITPVNILRHVLDSTLGTGLGRLPDKLMHGRHSHPRYVDLAGPIRAFDPPMTSYR